MSDLCDWTINSYQSAALISLKGRLMSNKSVPHIENVLRLLIPSRTSWKLVYVAYPSTQWLLFWTSLLFVSLLVFSINKRFWARWRLTILIISYTTVWFLRAPRWFIGPTAMPRAAVPLLAVTADRGISGGTIYQPCAWTKSRYYHYYHLSSWSINVL